MLIGDAMDVRLKKLMLEFRRELLRGHIENVGTSPGFERELAKAETELRELEQSNAAAR